MHSSKNGSRKPSMKTAPGTGSGLDGNGLRPPTDAAAAKAVYSA